MTRGMPRNAQGRSSIVLHGGCGPSTAPSERVPGSKKPHKASFLDRLLDSVPRPAWSSPPEQSGPAHTVQVIYEACRQPSYGQKIDNFEGGGQKIDNLWASVRCQRPC
jgi:hypothetical protein